MSVSGSMTLSLSILARMISASHSLVASRPSVVSASPSTRHADPALHQVSQPPIPPSIKSHPPPNLGVFPRCSGSRPPFTARFTPALAAYLYPCSTALTLHLRASHIHTASPLLPSCSYPDRLRLPPSRSYSYESIHANADSMAAKGKERTYRCSRPGTSQRRIG
ncbi:hypothetical protein R3P38DRAFT_496072 [Favolaschia claudopus]|uniref:Secreted protein n=1 Tax=Favolaschia claudopus TaxID=2862362 RepID=A0AAW0CMJ9_9AGAR